MLAVDGISVRSGSPGLCRGLTIPRGEIHALIGPNGAGKTTLLNCISGFYHPFEGHIRFGGHDRTRLRPPDVAALGIARTFQNVALFRGMSVLDNIMTGRIMKMRGSFLFDAVWWGPARRQSSSTASSPSDNRLLEIQAIRNTSSRPLRTASKRVELPGPGRRAPAPDARPSDGGMNVEEKEDCALSRRHGEFAPPRAHRHDMGVVMDISNHVVV